MSESEQRFGEFVAIRKHAHGHVAELVLDRPKAMNAVFHRDGALHPVRL
jgi:cell envelope opacity-associated protein A